MKTDFKRTLDCYRARSGEFRVVDVPPLQYLRVHGRGDPNTAPEYADAVSALYPVAYRIKFASKQQLGRDYVVPPLEALWWAPDMDVFTSARDKSRWEWTVLLMTPEWITGEMFHAAVAAVAAKNGLAALDRVGMGTVHEGLCVQTLHVGSYDDEAGVLATLHEQFIPTAGLQMTGRHHEIYLSDPRRVEPSKLRTILRQPVEQVSAPR